MNPLRRGYLYGLLAYTMWGFFPLYFKLLEPAGPVEILAQRIVWSAAFVTVLLLATRRRWRFLRDLARRPRTLAGITAAALLISVNWACTSTASSPTTWSRRRSGTSSTRW